MDFYTLIIRSYLR